MEPLIEISLILAVSLLLSLVAYAVKVVTKDAAVASFAVGSVTGLFGGIEWFVLLILFTTAGFAATKLNFAKKKDKGLQEGNHGERTYKNILGVGLAPCLFAVLYFIAGEGNELIMSIGFIASISVAAADTLASEIGVSDENVWLCTTFEKVPPGTDGGLSLFGTLISLAGAVVTSILGWLVLYQTLDVLLIIPAAAGFIGSYLDSILGATIESKGWISKYTNNASTAIMGAFIAMIMALPFV